MAASHPKLNFRDHDRIVPAIESIHTPDVAGGNTLLTAAANDDMRDTVKSGV
ncbi:hypothetical protein GS910_42755 [Paraburkholderia sp. RL16-012-BIC-B]|uniref:hypothetical protein n=1 Tax=Paraburkholderia madseniana TaxID=2599607 RepID=UPI0015C55ACA|nr:hypothetical protein [Paraburkholderia madseniana]NPT70866.1 hypothetical protein [Paraburkholderia madseniana]